MVLEPDAVSDLLGNLAARAFNGRAVNERRSFVRLGEDQFDPAITLVDDPLAVGLGVRLRGHARAGGSRWSTPAAPSASRTTGVPRPRPATVSTGHRRARTAFALRPDGAPPRHASPHRRARRAWPPRSTGPVADSSVAELVAGVERGMLVSDFWYTRVLDPRTLSITGLTRNGVWLVEDGAVTAPVTQLPVHPVLRPGAGPGQRAARSGARRPPIPGDTYTATSPRWSCPALHLASWNFTGGASG